jgi:hypothetical protein
VKHNQRHQYKGLVTRLSRERGQTMPEYTFTLSVISGSSVLAFTRLSDSPAHAITGLMRLFL